MICVYVFNKYYRMSEAECLWGLDGYWKVEKIKISKYWSNSSRIDFSRG